jgi:predicted dehydrogenase
MTNPTTNRRSLLKGAAAGAFPFILPSHIWSAETKPNDKITMGFIGMGRQNRGLLGNFLGQDTQVLAVCDVDTTRRDDAKKTVDDRYKNTDCAAYSDFEEIVGRKDLDAICIATPDHWHAVTTLAALRAGKDVYCEKPLTHNIHEAKEVIAAVAKHGRVLQTGSMQRSSGEFRTAADLVRNGVIGKIERVECSFGDPGRPCDLKEEDLEPGLDWNKWCGPGPIRPYSSVLSPRGVHNHFPAWRNYKEYGGGMVCDWGAHHLDIAQWGLGRDGDGPVKVHKTKEKDNKRGCVLEYADGVTVKHVNGFGVHFFGENGEVKVNRGKFELVVNGEVFSSHIRNKDGDKDGSVNAAYARADREFLNDSSTRVYKSVNHIRDFLDAMRSRKKPITSEIVGGGTAICCHLMNISYYNEASFDWDPQKQTFANGTGDAKWLTRDYRCPYSV